MATKSPNDTGVVLPVLTSPRHLRKTTVPILSSPTAAAASRNINPLEIAQSVD